MDDLTAANYKNLNRMFGLNFEQMKVCLRSLAAWHAASVQLMQMVRINCWNWEMLMLLSVRLSNYSFYSILSTEYVKNLCIIWKAACVPYRYTTLSYTFWKCNSQLLWNIRGDDGFSWYLPAIAAINWHRFWKMLCGRWTQWKQHKCVDTRWSLVK